MRAALLAGVILILSSRATAAADWLKLTDWADGHGGRMNVFIDLDSERETLPNQYHGVIKDFWVKLVHPDGAYDEAKYSVDCGARTFSVLSAETYDKVGAGVKSYAKEFGTPIPPDSLVDLYRSKVCPTE